MDFSSEPTKSVSFWTSDFPELICIGNFFKEKEADFRNIYKHLIFR